MPTPTEARLQVILKNVENVRAILGSRLVANMSRHERRNIVAGLQSIGSEFILCPSDFKEYCNFENLSIIEQWGLPGHLSPRNLNQRTINTAVHVLDRTEPEIRRHAFPDDTIQNGILNNLDNHYEQLSKEWYANSQTPYVLITVTGIFAVIRIALFEGFAGKNDLTSEQFFAYSILGLIVLLSALGIVFQPTVSRFRISTRAIFYSNIQFYEISIGSKMYNIVHLKNRLRKRKIVRNILSTLWIPALLVSIFITPIEIN